MAVFTKSEPVFSQQRPLGQGIDDKPVTERHCFCISGHVGVNWKGVLRELAMSEIVISNIEEDFKSCRVTEKCYKGLLAWMESVGPQKATIIRLRDALLRVGCPEAVETLLKEDTSTHSDC
ncbi:hypothetical protein ACROYT_G033857 [Oculina patagonica]